MEKRNSSEGNISAGVLLYKPLWCVVVFTSNRHWTTTWIHSNNVHPKAPRSSGLFSSCFPVTILEALIVRSKRGVKLYDLKFERGPKNNSARPATFFGYYYS